MTDTKADTLLPCPFCGPGQSMVDPWFDDVSKRWAVGCGRCGASTGRSVHAEGSKEAAIKSWNTRGLAASQPAAPSKLASSERLGPHYDGTRSITSSLTPDGGGVTTPTPQPAAPLGGREALARMIRKALVENWRDDYDGRQWDEDVLLTGCRKVGGGIGYQKPEEAAQRLALDAADAILAAILQATTIRSCTYPECLDQQTGDCTVTRYCPGPAIPQERGVERDGEAGTYDDDGITHASTYDEGITYAIMQLAELTGSKDWQIRDGSEDHATDVQDTIMDVLKCAGLYDDETGKLATIATTTANVVAGTDRAAIIEECALRLDDSAAYEDRHIEVVKKDHGLSETGRESLIEHAVTRRTAFRQGALSIRHLRALAGKETGR